MPIKIEVMDFDDLFGDDLVGLTDIDLDDRFFNSHWSSQHDKPIEYRDLWHHSSTLSQGVISCWVEINEQNVDKKTEKVWDVEPEPLRDYQLRLCVLSAENVPLADVEGTSDVYVKCYVVGNDKDKKSTDTHFRSTGAGSWNYRMLFDV